jgi:glutamate synthase (ferredoxin)
VADGANLLILSDRSINARQARIPVLLATSGLHHHLIAKGLRVRASLIVESGAPREVHHFATLIGYGADAINPYLAYATIADMLDKGMVNRYFRGTASRIGGIDLAVIAAELSRQHQAAFPDRPVNGHTLAAGGRFQFREDGEFHLYNPTTTRALQHACRSGDYAAYQRYAADINDQSRAASSLRGLMALRYAPAPLPLDEVESIVRRGT